MTPSRQVAQSDGDAVDDLASCAALVDDTNLGWTLRQLDELLEHVPRR